MNIQQNVLNLLEKWNTAELSTEELVELEKGTKKVLSTIKMNLLLTTRKA